MGKQYGQNINTKLTNTKSWIDFIAFNKIFIFKCDNRTQQQWKTSQQKHQNCWDSSRKFIFHRPKSTFSLLLKRIRLNTFSLPMMLLFTLFAVYIDMNEAWVMNNEPCKQTQYSKAVFTVISQLMNNMEFSTS